MEQQRIAMENGELRWRRAGDSVELEMEIRPPEPGLYRGILIGPAGRLDLGLLLPKKGGAELSRTVPVERLERRGCWPVTGGRAEMSHRFQGQSGRPQGWRPLEQGRELFPADPVLARAVQAAPGGLFCQGAAGRFSLAYPWDPAAPFPLPPAFCFAAVRPLNGRRFLFFRFHGDGTPVIEGRE